MHHLKHQIFLSATFLLLFLYSFKKYAGILCFAFAPSWLDSIMKSNITENGEKVSHLNSFFCFCFEKKLHNEHDGRRYQKIKKRVLWKKMKRIPTQMFFCLLTFSMYRVLQFLFCFVPFSRAESDEGDGNYVQSGMGGGETGSQFDTPRRKMIVWI